MSNANAALLSASIAVAFAALAWIQRRRRGDSTRSATLLLLPVVAAALGFLLDTQREFIAATVCFVTGGALAVYGIIDGERRRKRA